MMISRSIRANSARLPGHRVVGPLALALLLTACSGDNDGVFDPPSAQPFAELYQQGILRYQGMYSPSSTTVDGEVTSYSFGIGDGPLCLDGSAYNMATRDQGSQDLVIFLQGGGACWSELCQASRSAPPGLPSVGILDPELATNPVRDWNQVYLPYCDGGLHASDKDNDYDNDGEVENPQRGLHNLSAALDVAAGAFPAPRRILLTGISGGAFGTTFALPLVRSLYPDVPIELVNDSGLGVSRPNDPDYLRLLMSDWNQTAFIPESCANCIPSDGHLSDYLDWQLDQDPNVRRAFMSYTRDTVIGTVFLGIGGEAFETALFPELMQMESAHPDRVRYWAADGAGHTFLLNGLEVTAGGVSALDWVTAMLEGSDEWVSTRD